jgi:hypothetical protein
VVAVRRCPGGEEGRGIDRILSAEQAENAGLRRQLEVSESRLKKTEAAFDLMEKLQAFYAGRAPVTETLMATYRSMRGSRRFLHHFHGQHRGFGGVDSSAVSISGSSRFVGN